MRPFALLLLLLAGCGPVKLITVSRQVDWHKKQVLICTWHPKTATEKCYTPDEFSVMAPAIAIAGISEE